MAPALAPAVVTLPPKVIVTDLDRTLTGADLVLDRAAVERIRELRAAGIKVVIATGRRYEEVLEMGLPELVDGVVAENGAIIIVPPERIMELLDARFAGVAREALGDLAARFHWGRALASGPRELADEVKARLDRAQVAHAIEYNAEELMLLPAGVDKASGATLCLARLGLRADDAWAFGDGENDVSMLRWAAVGFAPANAAPVAKQAADVHVAAEYSNAFLEATLPLVQPTDPPSVPPPRARRA